MSDAPVKPRHVSIGSLTLGNDLPLTLIAGPCQMESREHALQTASILKELCAKAGVGLIYKTSFDKANRTSVSTARGIGIEESRPIFAEIRESLGVPTLTDVHLPEHCAAMADVVDVLQIPAFLCRQTDLLLAAGNTGKVVNIKKGQFMAPRDMRQAVDKVRATGNDRIMLTERGSTFGYNNLVVDMRSLAIMRELGVPVVFDATHAVQLPGGQGSASGGERQFVPLLARAAVAAGVDAVFMEVHPCPDKALCDGPNSWPLDQLEGLVKTLRALDKLSKKA